MNQSDDEIVEEVFSRVCIICMCRSTFPSFKQIPVYLSKNLADTLFVLQYPTKKVVADPNDAVVLRSCVKPMDQEIKIAYKPNVNPLQFIQG